jgi:hypothetical protein
MVLYPLLLKLIINVSINYNSLTKVLQILIMPTDLHDCHQDWIKKELSGMERVGFLTPDEHDSLQMRVGTSMCHPP